MILRKILLDLYIHYRNVVKKNNIGLISHIGIYYTALGKGDVEFISNLI